jgi:SPP1 gp7 family putative phage head morphogenesis protein
VPKGSKLLAAIRPNAGLEAAYQKKLLAMVDDLHASVLYWLTSAYRNNTPEMAQDASPAAMLKAAMDKLARRWQKNFNDGAPEVGKWFAQSVAERTDSSLRAAVKKAGFSVSFTMSKEANDVMQATTAENVSLIKSISRQYLGDVEQLVMRSVAQGRDIGGLTKDLEDRYGITRRRAALIARTENNKASANIERVRQKQMGVTEAVWKHSHGGRHPRPSHVAADGKTYKIDEGMFLDGAYIRPRELIGCRCMSRAVIPAFEGL